MRTHRFAVATAIATFFLTVVGTLVTVTESGLACPDWPLCEGQWLPRMINGKQFEHGHRLFASFVLVMTVGLAALLFKHRRNDKKLWVLGFVGVGLVLIQALLGALTVVWKLPWEITSLHFAVAMGFFCLVVSVAWMMYQRPLVPPAVSADSSAQTTSVTLKYAVLIVMGLAFCQLVAGGVMRHLRAGMACGFDFPLCNGALWPMNSYVGVHVHMVHRVLGVVVGLAVFFLTASIFKLSQNRQLRIMGTVASVSVVAQVVLGMYTIWSGRNLWVMTFHSALGTALMALLVSMYWVAFPSHRTAFSDAENRSNSNAVPVWPRVQRPA